MHFLNRNPIDLYKVFTFQIIKKKITKSDYFTLRDSFSCDTNFYNKNTSTATPLQIH